MFIALGTILCALHILSNLTFTIIFILHFFFLIYSILQVSKLRQKEVKLLVQGHKARKW